jgi:hypothetical protein
MSEKLNNQNTDPSTSDKPVNNPKSNERLPGQGNSSDGLTRRLGAIAGTRGEKEKEKLSKSEGEGETHRTREGSQGGSKGQMKS